MLREISSIGKLKRPYRSSCLKFFMNFVLYRESLQTAPCRQGKSDLSLSLITLNTKIQGKSVVLSLFPSRRLIRYTGTLMPSGMSNCTLLGKNPVFLFSLAECRCRIQQ